MLHSQRQQRRKALQFRIRPAIHGFLAKVSVHLAARSPPQLSATHSFLIVPPKVIGNYRETRGPRGPRNKWRRIQEAKEEYQHNHGGRLKRSKVGCGRRLTWCRKERIRAGHSAHLEALLHASNGMACYTQFHHFPFLPTLQPLDPAADLLVQGWAVCLVDQPSDAPSRGTPRRYGVLVAKKDHLCGLHSLVERLVYDFRWESETL